MYDSCAVCSLRAFKCFGRREARILPSYLLIPMRRLLYNLPFIILSASLATKVVSGLSTKASNNNSHHHAISTRRNWIEKLVRVSATSTLCITQPVEAAQEVQELPIDLRKYTALAPLGDASTSTGSKLTGLSMERIASRLSHDLVAGSTGKGGYFISGKPLIPNIFISFISDIFLFLKLLVS